MVCLMAHFLVLTPSLPASARPLPVLDRSASDAMHSLYDAMRGTSDNDAVSTLCGVCTSLCSTHSPGTLEYDCREPITPLPLPAAWQHWRQS